MLVLTRRSKDKIFFPQLDVTIHFIRVQSGQVKVGVDAPREITILRDEIRDNAPATISEHKLASLPKNVRHGIRNELHQISVGMHLYKELMSAGLKDEASEVFTSIQESISRVDASEALSAPEAPMTVPTSDSVVVVEDDSNQREMLASVLRMNERNVVSLVNGDEVISYFHDHPPPGYLLINMNMPVCDGAQAISTLRSENLLEQTNVFAISGMSPEVYGVPVGSDGVDRWFPKPLNPATLLEAMN